MPVSSALTKPIVTLVSDNLKDVAQQHRGLVLLAAASMLVLLGAVASAIASRVAAPWIMVGVGLIVLTALVNSILLYALIRADVRREETEWSQRFRLTERTSTESQERIRRASRSVNGTWWEVVYSRNGDGEAALVGLTVATFNLKPLEASFDIGGNMYSRDGRFRAYWRAESVGMDVDPVRIFYRWAGRSVGNESTAGDTVLSGIGTFDFDRAPDDELSQSGSGWYTIGDVDRLEFERRLDVSLHRCSREEIAMLSETDDPASRAYVAARFERFALRYSGSPENAGGAEMDSR